jgi:diguanylate cyclase (GGDEF)-like protein
LFNYLRDAIYNPAAANLDVEKLPEDFRDYGKGLRYYTACVAEVTALANALSKGDLNGASVSRGNELAAPLKALNASLRHLTWQSQQVAKGDYKQRVDFMGDFAGAFNAMIEQLDQQRKALLEEIENGRRKTQALAQSNSLFEAITEQISQWIIVMDRESGEWLYNNHEIENILADPTCEPLLRLWLERRGIKEDEIAGAERAEMELPCAGGSQYFSVAIYPLHWHEREALAFVLSDVSSEKAHLRRLETVAYRDTLTKVYNRHYGMEVLGEWLAKGWVFAICFVDIDNLKYVNDKFGHAEGDRYIVCVVEVLRLFSEDALICRLGGDEFMLLMQNWTMRAAEKRLEELRELLVQRNDNPDALYSHSMSYGVIETSRGNPFSASELLGMADEKMYEYKRAHKAERQNNAI